MKIDITELEFYKKYFDVKIDTPDGFQNIGELYKKPNKKCYEIVFSNTIIKCSEDHLFQLNNNEWVKTKDIQVKDKVLSKDGISEVIQKTYIGIHDTFDLEVLHDNHRYYSNNIVSHNSGKTLLALGASMRLLDTQKDKFDKIIYIRKTVISDDQELGFLPGSLDEKMIGYLGPLYSNLEYIVLEKYKNRKESMTKEDITTEIENLMIKYGIEVMYEGHLRGTNIRNAVVIWDECLADDQILDTNLGKLSIKDIWYKYNKNEEIKLKSYNHITNKYEYKLMNSLKRKIIPKNEKMYEIKTSDGEILKVTGNHKLFVNGEYTKVKKIVKGDKLWRP